MDFKAIIGHGQSKQQLIKSWQQARLSHSYLITGPEGIGKRTLITAFGHLLLCEKPNMEAAEACQTCASCHWLKAETHPDWVTLVPEKDNIAVDKIRELRHQLAYQPHAGGRRVVIIDDAHLMNIAASNALLKILEEPPEATHFFLITAHPDRLLSTIRSRCRALSCQTLSDDELRQVIAAQGVQVTIPDQLLKSAEGRAGYLLAHMDDDFWSTWQSHLHHFQQLVLGQAAGSPLDFAAELEEADDVDALLGTFQSWCWQELSSQLSQQADDEFDVAYLTKAFDVVQDARTTLLGPANKLLTLENMSLQLGNLQ